MVRVRSRILTGQTRLPTNKETIRTIVRLESVGTNQSIDLWMSIVRPPSAPTIVVHRTQSRCRERESVRPGKETNETVVWLDQRTAMTDFFLILIGCFHVDHIFDCFTTFEWFIRAIVKDEHNGLKLKNPIARWRHSSSTHVNQIDQMTNVIQFLHMQILLEYSHGIDDRERERERIRLTTPPMSCTRRTTSFSLRFVSYCTQ